MVLHCSIARTKLDSARPQRIPCSMILVSTNSLFGRFHVIQGICELCPICNLCDKNILSCMCWAVVSPQKSHYSFEVCVSHSVLCPCANRVSYMQQRPLTRKFTQQMVLERSKASFCVSHHILQMFCAGLCVCHDLYDLVRIGRCCWGQQSQGMGE